MAFASDLFNVQYLLLHAHAYIHTDTRILYIRTFIFLKVFVYIVITNYHSHFTISLTRSKVNTTDATFYTNAQLCIHVYGCTSIFLYG